MAEGNTTSGGTIGISDLTIGYDSNGVNNYVESIWTDIDTKVITEKIENPRDALIAVIKSGWAGSACETYCTKLEATGATLRKTLLDMHNALKKGIHDQADTFKEEDSTMEQEISQFNFMEEDI